jgi:hypothetical protein
VFVSDELKQTETTRVSRLRLVNATTAGATPKIAAAISACVKIDARTTAGAKTDAKTARISAAPNCAELIWPASRAHPNRQKHDYTWILLTTPSSHLRWISSNQLCGTRDSVVRGTATACSRLRRRRATGQQIPLHRDGNLFYIVDFLQPSIGILLLATMTTAATMNSRPSYIPMYPLAPTLTFHSLVSFSRKRCTNPQGFALLPPGRLDFTKLPDKICPAKERGQEGTVSMSFRIVESNGGTLAFPQLRLQLRWAHIYHLCKRLDSRLVAKNIQKKRRLRVGQPPAWRLQVRRIQLRLPSFYRQELDPESISIPHDRIGSCPD